MTAEYPSNAPQLGSIPTLNDAKYPNTASAGSHGTQDTKNSFAESEVGGPALGAQSALNSVTNHPAVQDAKNTVSNGPVGQSVKNQTAKTSSELQNLANSRVRPTETTATGQQLTQYHSLFYNLLSWKNPRATLIAFLLSVGSIFAARYIPLLRYITKALYLTLGATAAAEVIGKLIFSAGFTSQLRPRKYYTLPKETVDQALDDVHELLNFFVIEFQRILFAENITNTITAFFAALAAYLLIKIVPFWGLTLLFTSLIYVVPFVYINNREAIDAQLDNATEVINKQTTQIKTVAGHHTARATESVKSYAGDYTAKAQEYIGAARQSTANAANKATASTTGRSASGASTSSVKPTTAGSRNTSSSYKSTDFPNAPVSDQFKATADELKTQTGATGAKKDNGPVLAS